MNNFKKEKNRYSIPESIIAPLFYDDEYFRQVSKLKKNGSGFPKEDQWIDERGFNLSFALAGYSRDDIDIEGHSNTISIKGNGIDGELPVETDKSISITKGKIIRGIARRKFHVKYIISEEFDITKATADMRHGLLHIIIPIKEQNIYKIDISSGE